MVAAAVVVMVERVVVMAVVMVSWCRVSHSSAWVCGEWLLPVGRRDVWRRNVPMHKRINGSDASKLPHTRSRCIKDYSHSHTEHMHRRLLTNTHGSDAYI